MISPWLSPIHLTTIPRRSKDIGRHARVFTRVASFHFRYFDFGGRTIEIPLYPGGSFQWSAVPENRDSPMRLAGGSPRVKVSDLPVPRRRHARRSSHTAFQLQTPAYPAGGRQEAPVERRVGPRRGTPRPDGPTCRFVSTFSRSMNSTVLDRVTLRLARS